MNKKLLILFMMLSLGLQFTLAGGFAHILALIRRGQWLDASAASVVTAFCLLMLGWALATVKGWMDD